MDARDGEAAMLRCPARIVLIHDKAARRAAATLRILPKS
jgi:hypothetical protein